MDASLKVLLDERPAVFSAALGWLEPALADECHRRGIKIMAMVSTVQDARAAAGAGADVLVAQGSEAGGHRSIDGKPASPETTSIGVMALLPQVVDAVRVPVVAAGGIADGRGLAAVLALGAAGAWVGTRFLAATEAAIHPDYRARILAAGEADTYYGIVFDRGWPDAPHRTLRNSTVEAWDGP